MITYRKLKWISVAVGFLMPIISTLFAVIIYVSFESIINQIYEIALITTSGSYEINTEVLREVLRDVLPMIVILTAMSASPFIIVAFMTNKDYKNKIDISIGKCYWLLRFIPVAFISFLFYFDVVRSSILKERGYSTAGVALLLLPFIASGVVLFIEIFISSIKDKYIVK